MLGGTAAGGRSIRVPVHVDSSVRAGEHGEVLGAKVHGARRALERLGDAKLLPAIATLTARAADIGHLLYKMARLNLLLPREKQRASLGGGLARKWEFLTSAAASLRGLSTTSTLLADIRVVFRGYLKASRSVTRREAGGLEGEASRRENGR